LRANDFAAAAGKKIVKFGLKMPLLATFLDAT
jgi:hypothetical protein